MKRNFPLKTNFLVALTSAALLSTTFTGCKKDHKATAGSINSVNHVVVIYLENHSFDNLYGSFEGANGIANAKTENITQVDANGVAYTTLPTVPIAPATPPQAATPTNCQTHYLT